MPWTSTQGDRSEILHRKHNRLSFHRTCIALSLVGGTSMLYWRTWSRTQRKHQYFFSQISFGTWWFKTSVERPFGIVVFERFHQMYPRSNSILSDIAEHRVGHKENLSVSPCKSTSHDYSKHMPNSPSETIVLERFLQLYPISNWISIDIEQYSVGHKENISISPHKSPTWHDYSKHVSNSLLEIVVFGRFLQLPPSPNSMSIDIEHGLEHEENFSISSHKSPTWHDYLKHVSNSPLEIVVFERFCQMHPISNSLPSNNEQYTLEHKENMNISSHESPTSHDCSKHVSSSLLENSCAWKILQMLPSSFHGVCVMYDTGSSCKYSCQLLCP